MDSIKEEIILPRQKGPYVRKQPRARNKNGTWRKKRSDSGGKRPTLKENQEEKHTDE